MRSSCGIVCLPMVPSPPEKDGIARYVGAPADESVLLRAAAGAPALSTRAWPPVSDHIGCPNAEDQTQLGTHTYLNQSHLHPATLRMTASYPASVTSRPSPSTSRRRSQPATTHHLRVRSAQAHFPFALIPARHTIAPPIFHPQGVVHQIRTVDRLSTNAPGSLGRKKPTPETESLPPSSLEPPLRDGKPIRLNIAGWDAGPPSHPGQAAETCPGRTSKQRTTARQPPSRPLLATVCN